MDLHAWIVQQVDRAEETARRVEDRSAPWDGQWMADGNSAVRTLNGHVLFYRHGPDPLKPGLADHVAASDPATVLRRCEADRRILARHTLNTDDCFESTCLGCDIDSWGLPHTDNLNDCPELLDLAHAHGLTDEIFAGLDRPTPPERKPTTGPRLGHQLTMPITTSDVPAALRGTNWKP